MKYIYTEKDLDMISWDRINKFINKIYKDVSNYLKEKELTIRYIVPILRGGGVPAIMLSHMFNVIDMLPIQLKYNNKIGKIETKVGFDYLENKIIKENECILLVEGNHVTGKTANIAVDMIRNKFGENTKIIYVSLTRDYTYKDSVKNVCFTTWAMTTNETKELQEKECKKLGINYNLVSVYPWESPEEELKELNKEGE